MDPKNAPYKCPCGGFAWSKAEFWQHIDECPDAREFFKVYNQLKKYYVNPEEYT